MKKTKFYVTMSGKTPTAKQVDGYYLYLEGVALGIHRWTKNDTWTVTELSTGFKITDGETRKKAVENVKPLLSKVAEMITREKCKPIKEMIKTAYSA